MNFSDSLTKLIENKDLSLKEMQDLMQKIMTGQLTDAQIAASLIALRMKGESVEELTAAASVMRSLSDRVQLSDNNLIDIVGTGGDGQNTFNISTTTCFVVAACGGTIAKHGNRSVSSKSGSADVLELAGVNINLSAQQVAQCIEACNIGFMFAPAHHKAMKHAINVRKELGVRTVFNLLGPLTNPANANTHIIGVFAKKWLMPMAQTLVNLGCDNLMVIHSQDGLDEISISAPTDIIYFCQGKFTQRTIEPKEFNCFHDNMNAIKVDSAEQSLAMMLEVLSAKPGPAYDIVALNAAAAIFCAQLSDSFSNALMLAKQALDSGAAAEKLKQLIKYSHQVKH